MLSKENWEYIITNWGSADESVMSEIAKIKDEDVLATEQQSTKITDLEEKVRSLTQQNVDINKTNMSLILRLTDPSLPPPTKADDYVAPQISDYDSFVKGV